jgi:hypothetical protein
MDADLSVLLDRVARAMESVVPGLMLTPEIGGDVWLADEDAAAGADGELVKMLGFRIGYRGDDLGPFYQGSSGSHAERVRDAAYELMSQVQDVVAESTREPWPLIVVNGRRDMAIAEAVIEGDELLMWYGERSAPTLMLPRVGLT